MTWGRSGLSRPRAGVLALWPHGCHGLLVRLLDELLHTEALCGGKGSQPSPKSTALGI